MKGLHVCMDILDHVTYFCGAVVNMYTQLSEEDVKCNTTDKGLKQVYDFSYWYPRIHISVGISQGFSGFVHPRCCFDKYISKPSVSSVCAKY